MLTIVKSLLNAVVNQISSKEEEKTHLDPLSTIIRLYTFVFRPLNTKLTIHNHHSIRFDHPDASWKRTGHSTRFDVRVLRPAIEQFLELYDMRHPQIAQLARGAERGLRTFSKCYDRNRIGSNLAFDSIEFYAMLLERALSSVQSSTTASVAAVGTDDTLGGGATNEQCDDVMVVEDSKKQLELHHAVSVSALKSAPTEDNNGGSGDAFSTIMRQLWTENQINIVHGIFMELEEKSLVHQSQQVEIDSLIDSIEKIVEFKDKRLLQFISSSLTHDNRL